MATLGKLGTLGGTGGRSIGLAAGWQPWRAGKLTSLGDPVGLAAAVPEVAGRAVLDQGVGDAGRHRRVHERALAVHAHQGGGGKGGGGGGGRGGGEATPDAVDAVEEEEEEERGCENLLQRRIPTL